jgi:uncharacterized delta-60 repeat protein
MILAIMGTAATSGSIPYWMGVTSGAGAKQGRAIATNTNDLFIAGIATPSNQECQVYKMTKSGAVTWQRSLATAGSDVYNGVAVDSSENIYTTGYIVGSGDDIVTAKYNSSGTIQFQRSLSTTTYTDRGQAIALNSSADIYIAGFNQTLSGGNNHQVAKYNSAGTLQWQRQLSNTSDNDQANGVALDSTGDVYTAGYNTATIQQALIAKWNSAGTFQWQRNISLSFNSLFYANCFDNAGAMYAVGYTDDSGADRAAYIAKFATTPALTWQRELDAASTDIFLSVDTDSADNVYAAGYTLSGGIIQGLIAKYNSSGTLQWQRTISQAANVLLLAVHVDASDAVYVAGYSTISGVQQMFVARLPSDGTLTGTYSLGGVSHTYGASSLTGSTPTYTLATPTLTASTSTLTDAASTATDASTSITFTTLTI